MKNLTQTINQESEGKISIDFIYEQLQDLYPKADKILKEDAEILLIMAEKLENIRRAYNEFTYVTYQTLRNEGKTHRETINLAEKVGFIDKETLRQFGRKYHCIEVPQAQNFYVDTQGVVHTTITEAQSLKIPEYFRAN